MALIFLVLIGLMVGWLASVVQRIEGAGDIVRMMLFAMVASVIAGVFANSGTILGGLSWIGLGVALAASIAVLAAYRYFIRETADG